MNVDRPRIGAPEGFYSPTPDLTHAPPFSLGPLRVEPALRRIAGPGGADVTIEPLVMQVLVALAEAAGAPLSRDDLIARCWGRRIVGDDAVNRAISNLRRALATAADDAVTVETIAKVGYRLRLAEPAGATAADSEPRAPAPNRRRRLLAAGLVAVALALAALAFWWANGSGERPVRIAVQPVAVDSTDPSALKFSSELGADLAELASATPDLAIVASDGGEARANMRLLVSVELDAPGLGARAQLVDGDSSEVLWAHNFRADGPSPQALRQRAAYGIAETVNCVLDPAARKINDVPARRLVFNLCDALQEDDPARVDDLARRLANTHPESSVPWNLMALSAIRDAEKNGRPLRPAAEVAARYSRRAHDLDPESPLTYLSRALVLQH